MADIKKVIKGLESCRYGCPGDECPYHEEIKCADMMTDALELLKEYKAIKETISDEIHETAKMFRREG